LRFLSFWVSFLSQRAVKNDFKKRDEIMKSKLTQRLLLMTIVALLISTGCSPRTEAPLSEGELISVGLLDKPYPNYKQHEFTVTRRTGGAVEIYESFIIVTSEEGESTLAPHGWYIDLIYNKQSKSR